MKCLQRGVTMTLSSLTSRATAALDRIDLVCHLDLLAGGGRLLGIGTHRDPNQENSGGRQQLK